MRFLDGGRRRFGAAIIVLGFVVLVATVVSVPFAAAVADPSLTPPAPGAAAPGQDECVPTKTRVCGATVASSSEGLARLATLLGQAATRRGFGLVPVRTVLGAGGAKALARAGGRVRARASAVTRQSLGTVGGVKVAAGGATKDAPGTGDQQGSVFESSELLRRGRNSYLQEMKLGAAFTRMCPDPRPGNQSHSRVKGNVNGRLRTVSVVVSGRRTTQTTVQLLLSGPTDVFARVDRNGEVDWIEPTKGEQLFVEYVRTIRQVDRTRSGVKRYSSRTAMRFSVDSLYRAIVNAPDDFASFIRRTSKEDPEIEGPPPQGVINRAGAVAVITQFVGMVGRRAFDEARKLESIWNTANRCVKATGAIPERMLPGSTASVRVGVTSPTYAPATLSGPFASTWAPFYRRGTLLITPDAYVAPEEPDAGRTFEIRAPAQRWPGTLPVVFVYQGNAGRAELEGAIAAVEPPAAYSGTLSSTVGINPSPNITGQITYSGVSVRFASRQDTGGGAYYTAVQSSGTASVHYSNGSDGCEYDGSGPIDFSQSSSALTLYASPPGAYTFTVEPGPAASVQLTRTGCNNPEDEGDTSTYPLYGNGILIVPEPGKPPATAEGANLVGTTSYSYNGRTMTGSWDFRPEP